MWPKDATVNDRSNAANLTGVLTRSRRRCRGRKRRIEAGINKITDAATRFGTVRDEAERAVGTPRGAWSAPSKRR
jgi:hypothetical protein